MARAQSVISQIVTHLERELRLAARIKSSEP